MKSVAIIYHWLAFYVIIFGLENTISHTDARVEYLVTLKLI